MQPLKTFIIYSSKDKSLREELESHLRPLADLGWLELWSDKEILPGEQWDATIKKQLQQTELFLMLVSVDFYNSGYIREEEFKTAIERLENGAALVIPIIIRHCTWKFYPIIKDLQVLPPGGIAVNDRAYWQHRDKAWDAVVQGIGDRVLAMREKEAQPAEKKPPVQAAPQSFQPQVQPHFKNGDTIRDLPDSPEMVFVEGGTFRMGSNEDKFEQPVHEVRVPSFWMGKYPVTFEEYDLFCAATKREKPAAEGWGRGRQPVIHVSWEDAQAYCEWLSIKTGQQYRLPSEAEWEFAAKGGIHLQSYIYAGGNNLNRVGWFEGNSNDKTYPVGQKAANGLGLYDMSGNVWEWCADTWHENYKTAPSDGSAWIKNGKEASAVLRGGSWGYDDIDCRAGARFFDDRVVRNEDFGFRVARDAAAGGE